MNLRELWNELWQIVRPIRPQQHPQIAVPRWIAEENKEELECRLLAAGFDLNAANTQITETEHLITYRQDST